jgi:hypothetical protein
VSVANSIAYKSSLNHIFYGASTELMRLVYPGNLGLGTSTPTAKLDIVDTVLAGSGSLSGSALNITQTWATSGAPTAIKLVVTDTASSAASNLLEMWSGSTPTLKINVDKSGNITVPNMMAIRPRGIFGNSGFLLGAGSSFNEPIFAIQTINSAGVALSIGRYPAGYSYLALNNTSVLGWGDNSNLSLNSPYIDTIILRDAPSTLALRNGVNPQELRVYRTYTDASNYERFFIRTNTGTTSATQIGLSAAGTGQNRNLELVAGGSTRMTIASSGLITSSNGLNSPSYRLYGSSGNTVFDPVLYSPSGFGQLFIEFTGSAPATSSYIKMYATGAWGSQFTEIRGSGDSGVLLLPFAAIGNSDTRIYRDAANTLAQRNGINPQSFRLYNTFTDTISAFERLNIKWESSVLKIGTEKGSTGGSARAMEFQTDGVTRMTFPTNGNAIVHGFINPSYLRLAYGGGGTAHMYCSGNGRVTLYNTAETGFDSIQLGGITSSFPAIKRNGAGIQTRLADDSANADLETANLTVVGSISAAGDIAVATSLQGVILVSPNSTRWKITINDDGSLQTTAL